MECTVKRVMGWNIALNSARTTVGKKDLEKEPSDDFKKRSLISEHAHIRNLFYEAVWTDIPYWVVNHLARHHIGFHSGEDDTVFVETQRSDRTGLDRDKLTQDAPVTFRAVMNAHSIINVSRVRLCMVAAKTTIEAWQLFLVELGKIEPILFNLCVQNCLYRGFCPEPSCCGFVRTSAYRHELEDYRKFIES